jgi:hypothetical protein
MYHPWALSELLSDYTKLKGHAVVGGLLSIPWEWHDDHRDASWILASVWGSAEQPEL